MHIVLVEPKIPQNTGSIARTCAATNTPLHIVGEPAFDLSDKAARRAGLDYWPHVELHLHESWEDYFEHNAERRIWLLSKTGERVYTKVSYESNDTLVFGSETTGLGKEFMERFPKDSILRIPLFNPAIRSLNLSNAVSIVLYEALRQYQS